MNKKSVCSLILRKQIENSLKQESEQTLSSRVTRYLKVKPPEVIPNWHFAPVAAQCFLLFRDGYFYACIALAQAGAEGSVRLLCERNCWKPAEDFERNVKDLSKRKFISGILETSFRRIWENRHDYHHLNPNIENDPQKLEDLAEKKLCLLAEIEKEIFHYTVLEGKVAPKQPKYWKQLSRKPPKMS